MAKRGYHDASKEEPPTEEYPVVNDCNYEATSNRQNAEKSGPAFLLPDGQTLILMGWVGGGLSIIFLSFWLSSPNPGELRSFVFALIATALMPVLTLAIGLAMALLGWLCSIPANSTRRPPDLERKYAKPPSGDRDWEM